MMISSKRPKRSCEGHEDTARTACQTVSCASSKNAVWSCGRELKSTIQATPLEPLTITAAVPAIAALCVILAERRGMPPLVIAPTAGGRRRG